MMEKMRGLSGTKEMLLLLLNSRGTIGLRK